MNVVISGLLTNYRDEGSSSAPVVVLLHGWGSSLQTFDGLATQLAEKYRVLRLDLPGFGGTQAPESPWHVADYAAFVAAYLQKLGAKQPLAVVGHSFGGRVIIKGLATHSMSARRVVLIGSAGVVHPANSRQLAYRAAAKAGKTVLALPGLKRFAPAMRRRLYQSAGAQDYLNAGPMRETFLNTIAEDLQSNAAQIRQPTLLIWGAVDADTPPVDGRTLANQISGSTFQLLAGAGHFVHLESPERVAALITDFLS